MLTFDIDFSYKLRVGSTNRRSDKDLTAPIKSCSYTSTLESSLHSFSTKTLHKKPESTNQTAPLKRTCSLFLNYRSWKGSRAACRGSGSYWEIIKQFDLIWCSRDSPRLLTFISCDVTPCLIGTALNLDSTLTSRIKKAFLQLHSKQKSNFSWASNVCPKLPELRVSIIIQPKTNHEHLLDITGLIKTFFV